nr:DUF2235 domain-containing protein [Bradyrhizobium sp. USDA 3458]
MPTTAQQGPDNGLLSRLLCGAALARDLKHPDWLRQVWLAGNHSDAGGSYPEDETAISTHRWVGWHAGERAMRSLVRNDSRPDDCTDKRRL